LFWSQKRSSEEEADMTSRIFLGDHSIYCVITLQ
jgi:hypothetical protein